CVTDRIDDSVLGVADKRVQLIANYGVGYDHIDVESAKRNGLKVSNTPDVLTDCTADLAMTLMLMIARRAGEGERSVRENQWHGWYPTHMMGAKVSGKTLGIIGMGRIGLAMAEKAHYGFGMKILYHNRSPVKDSSIERMGAKFYEDMEELLPQVDFVALHCPGGPVTHHLINAARLSMMKPGSFLINTARGNVIDETALVQALQERRIAGAGLDVYEHEPQVNDALKSLDNVVLLPHLGSATLETRTAMGMRVLDNLRAWVRGDSLPDQIA
ncbi:MAG: D-glycerate dehydrogenase, partial [Pseudohongiellaceae bacterium]